VSKAMFCAEIWRTSPLPPDALADADADSEGSTEADAEAEADADAEALAPADPLGKGVADGAGAYVQPGFAEVHAAASSSSAATTDRERRLRIGWEDLIRWRGGPRSGVRDDATASRRSGAHQYEWPSTSPVPSSGLSRDHLATSLHLPRTGASAAPQGDWSPHPDDPNRYRSSLAHRCDRRPDRRRRTRARRRPSLVDPAGPEAARRVAKRPPTSHHARRTLLAGDSPY
jgi:hypothetical protein